MPQTPFRDRLRSGARLLGTIVQIPRPEVVIRLGRQGFDWLFLDGEHGGFGPAEVAEALQALPNGPPCLVRVPSHDGAVIEAVVTCGPEGVIVPHVDTVAQAEAIVNRVAGRCLVVIQVESREAVANIQGLAQVAGVDAVFVGPYDLTDSLGIAGQFGHPGFQAALATVVQACQATRMPLGIFRMTAAEVSGHEPQGFTLLAVGLDGTLLEAGAQGLLAELRRGPYSGQ